MRKRNISYFSVSERILDHHTEHVASASPLRLHPASYRLLWEELCRTALNKHAAHKPEFITCALQLEQSFFTLLRNTLKQVA